MSGPTESSTSTGTASSSDTTPGTVPVPVKNPRSFTKVNFDDPVVGADGMVLRSKGDLVAVTKTIQSKDMTRAYVDDGGSGGDGGSSSSGRSSSSGGDGGSSSSGDGGSSVASSGTPSTTVNGEATSVDGISVSNVSVDAPDPSSATLGSPTEGIRGQAGCAVRPACPHRDGQDLAFRGAEGGLPGVCAFLARRESRLGECRILRPSPGADQPVRGSRAEHQAR